MRAAALRVRIWPEARSARAALIAGLVVGALAGSPPAWRCASSPSSAASRRSPWRGRRTSSSSGRATALAALYLFVRPNLPARPAFATFVPLIAVTGIAVQSLVDRLETMGARPGRAQTLLITLGYAAAVVGLLLSS